MTDTAAIDRPPYLVVDSPYEIANWRPLAHWAMYIPHAIVLYFLAIVAQAMFVVYWLIVLFTGRPNPSLYRVLVMYERYNTRASGFLVGFTEQYAPFDFHGDPADNGGYPPIRLDLPAPPETVSRVKLLNPILAIPHFIVFALIAIAAMVVAVIGWFAVLFTGRWPEDMRAFLVRVTNYYYRIWTYVAMVDNDYPRFGLPAA